MKRLPIFTKLESYLRGSETPVLVGTRLLNIQTLEF